MIEMLSYIDIIGGGICFILLWRFLLFRIRSFDPRTRKLFRTAFFFRIICAIVFSLITAYYYGGGDTEMFFYATRDIYDALKHGDISIPELIATTDASDANTILHYYFEMDDSKYPVGGFMYGSGNFLVPKLGVIPYSLFFHSYIAMCFVFSFFALEGSIRLYQLFTEYFPSMRSEMAIAFLFLPSVCYWSSGFLKDSICFGSIGFLLYGLYNLVVRRRKIIGSALAIAISVYFLYTIKVYILLALVPAISFWLLGEMRRIAKDRMLRRAIAGLAIILAAIGGVALVNYMTSESALAKFSLDNILETSTSSREMFESQSARTEGSYFQIESSNPVMLALNGLVATFFRPFPWEITSAIVLLSAIESFLFLALVIFLIYQKGVIKLFTTVFAEPVLMLAFVFAVVFAISVGASATNFGSLSRYKIPCLPFYLIFIMVSYRFLSAKYPTWFKRILERA